MRHPFKLSAVRLDKPLDGDLVDMPPYDDVWANRRFVHDTISGAPQTSLNGRPRNVPRNAELMIPLDEPLWRRREKLRHNRDDYDGSFPWRVTKHHSAWRRRPSTSLRHRAPTQSVNMDMVIQLILLLNVALVLYIILRLL